MSFCSVKKLRARCWRILVPTVILFTLADCGGEATSTLTVPSPETGTPIKDTSPTRLPANGTTLTPMVAPTPTTAVTETPSDPTLPPDTPAPLELELLAPQDGAGVETGALRVLGKTRVDAVVGINGVPVEVSSEGSFTQDISLDEGINLVEVVATDLTGQTAAEQALVFFITTTAGLPFSLFYPTDGLETAEPAIPLTGHSTDRRDQSRRRGGREWDTGGGECPGNLLNHLDPGRRANHHRGGSHRHTGQRAVPDGGGVSSALI